MRSTETASLQSTTSAIRPWLKRIAIGTFVTASTLAAMASASWASPVEGC